MKRILGLAFLAFSVFLVGLGFKFLFFDSDAPDFVTLQDCNVHPENEGKYVMMIGKPTYDGKVVEDPVFGVRVKTAALKRIVEMYQYQKNGPSDKPYMTRGWSSKSEGGFEDRYGKRYSNPSMPYRSEDFGGELTFNNGTLKIDKDYAPKFTYSSYVDFKDSYPRSVVPVKKLYSNKLPAGYVNMETHFYKASEGNTAAIIFDSGNRRDNLRNKLAAAHIGDIRVSYKALSVKNLPECTIIGKQVNGVLIHDSRSKLVDSRLSLDEIKKAYRSSSRMAFMGSFVCAMITFAIGMYIMS